MTHRSSRLLALALLVATARLAAEAAVGHATTPPASASSASATTPAAKPASAAAAHAAKTTAAGSAHATQATAAPASPDQILQQLLAGNQRFAAGTPLRPNQSLTRRTQLASGQQPVAIVLTCADSRLSPELIFDQGLGDLFVVRNAGNLLDDHVLGSIEYAVEHLHAHLIVVMGHEKCGAVAAAVAGGHAPGHIPSIVESIEPVVADAKKAPGDAVDNTVRANARHVASILTRVEPILSREAGEGKLKVVAGRYDLDTGKFELLP